MQVVINIFPWKNVEQPSEKPSSPLLLTKNHFQRRILFFVHAHLVLSLTSDSQVRNIFCVWIELCLTYILSLRTNVWRNRFLQKPKLLRFIFCPTFVFSVFIARFDFFFSISPSSSSAPFSRFCAYWRYVHCTLSSVLVVFFLVFVDIYFWFRFIYSISVPLFGRLLQTKNAMCHSSLDSRLHDRTATSIVWGSWYFENVLHALITTVYPAKIETIVYVSVAIASSWWLNANARGHTERVQSSRATRARWISSYRPCKWWTFFEFRVIFLKVLLLRLIKYIQRLLIFHTVYFDNHIYAVCWAFACKPE